ncbi:MAG: nucleoside 2-deoxyribosyltransferase [Prevotella sp.]|nr:nucleoside 2-deoxyribosyltransferase [Prevotella sp.]
MNKKVYFAGSIRGGRLDANLYKRIIEYIQLSDTVLTEHVGDLALSALERGPQGDRAIYEQDTAWLRQSDLLIAECSCPSLGVGYELAYAEHLNIPCHIFYNKTHCQLSAMLTGNTFFNIYPYEHEEEIFQMIDRIISS